MNKYQEVQRAKQPTDSGTIWMEYIFSRSPAAFPLLLLLLRLTLIQVFHQFFVWNKMSHTLDLIIYLERPDFPPIHAHTVIVFCQKKVSERALSKLATISHP